VGAPAPPTDAPAPPAASGTEARVPPLAARAEETPVDAGAGASSPPAAGPREPPPRVVSAQTVASGAPGSAAGGTAVAAAAVVALLALLGIALYQRVARPAALDHPMRSAAYAACLRHERGATAGEVGRALGIGRKSAEYHLLYLARVGLLRADASEGRPRRFAAPSVSPRPAAAPLPERVLDLVRARGEVRLSAIIVALDVKWSRADGCVKTLLLDGRLASRWTSKGRVYRLPS
jgi:DNA-binding transcriptional ArsR family regulator